METLKKGSQGDQVAWLQQKLIDYGYSTCFVDGIVKKLTVDGEFGIITQSALESFQAKILDSLTQDFITKYVPVEYQGEFVVNGEMNFAVHYVLENFDKLKEWYKVEVAKPEVIEEPIETPPVEEEPKVEENPESIVDTVIRLAKAELGTVEHDGNNYGERVQEYQRVGSNGEVQGGAPWCAYFQNWLEIKACEERGIDYKGDYCGYTPSIVNSGVSHGIGKKNCTFKDVEIGDWGFVYSSARGNAKHIFLIIGKSGNSVTTIEGNTNSGGGSDGFGVFQRKRPLGNSCWAIVKWWKRYE